MNLPGGGLHGEPRRSLARTLAVAGAVAAVGCLVAFGLTGCSSSDGSEPSGSFGPGQPKSGECYRLTSGSLLMASSAAKPVSCSSPHTSLTIAVGGLPGNDVTQTNVADGKLGAIALARCAADWQHFAGGNAVAWHTTVVGYASFLPTGQQLSDGAHWYRCDLVIGGSGAMPLQQLPHTVRGLLSGTVPDSLRACRTSPGFDAGHEVPCTSQHVLRAVGVAPLNGTGVGYPGDTSLRAQSAKGCAPVVRSWLHGRIGGGVAYQWPDKQSWNLLGDHDATCWTVTTS